MKQSDVVILGGLSGISAGISCRRHYPDKKVTLIRKEDAVLVPCGIPYIYGTLGGPENNIVSDSPLESNGIELITGEAVDLDRDKKIIALKDAPSIEYDKLVFATGSLPVIPPIPGADKKNVFAVKKEVHYLKRLLEKVRGADNIVIIGGGFIGMEFADECKKARENACVTVVEALPRCLQLAMDDEYCDEARAVLEKTGVRIWTNERIVSIDGGEKAESVTLEGGRKLQADLALLGIGALPNTRLAEKAGLELGFRKAIQVDRYMRTLTDKNIFACGDCATKQSFFDGRPSGVMLASVAASEARIAGANLFSPTHRHHGVISVFATVLNGRAFGVAGLTERMAREDGMDIVAETAQAPDTHPAGMPGSTLMKVKLIFSRGAGALLGGAVSGGKSTGEMVNMLSACILNRMSVDDMVKFQMGTHPALTPSPIAYPIVNAACRAIVSIRGEKGKLK
ncbi:Pyridine nucleotide-disulfide oxidoreductase [Candidatus Desulfarcum epimagneticum]|uniref:Pyridine nucleotide-disulfide oxidoreductase n=1 Tax=uncultured Desulfobacteraceae bacterium TaxID=218296 RepID=A0A484HMZ8_9BACT|nr:Pyridine nucleotide-disulfide oxidoreductase [uncultured Desulfobacteraceae bacterium]